MPDNGLPSTKTCSWSRHSHHSLHLIGNAPLLIATLNVLRDLEEVWLLHGRMVEEAREEWWSWLRGNTCGSRIWHLVHWIAHLAVLIETMNLISGTNPLDQRGVHVRLPVLLHNRSWEQMLLLESWKRLAKCEKYFQYDHSLQSCEYAIENTGKSCEFKTYRTLFIQVFCNIISKIRRL